MRSRDDYDLVVFYEDILSDKEKVCRELLEVCDIPLEYVPEASKFENELFKFYLIRHFQCKTDHKTFLDLSHTYRVRHPLGWLVWVCVYFSCSTLCLLLLGLMGNWQN